MFWSALIILTAVTEFNASPADIPLNNNNNVQLQLNPIQEPNAAAPSIRFTFFDMELFQELTKSGENVFISPASIKSVLAMILEGSKGLCAKEISDVLRIPIDQREIREKLKPLLYDLSDKGRNTVLESTNGLFISNKYTIVPSYKEKLDQFYRVFATTLDFSNADRAAQLINGWISNNTHGLINEVVTSDNFRNDASIVITNTLYFKGIWKKAFDEHSTSVKCFKNPTSSCIKVYMMQNIDTYNYGFLQILDSHVVEIPYDDDKYAMMIILPKQNENIQLLLRDLQKFHLNDILSGLQDTEIFLDLPRFNIQYEADLSSALKNLQIKEIFRPSANLSGIVQNGNVYVNNIIHKTKIEVNERGTIAAASSGAVVIPLMGSSMPRIIVDHPFAFFIYHKKTSNIIFEGVINKPTEATEELKQRNFEQPQYTARKSFF